VKAASQYAEAIFSIASKTGGLPEKIGNDLLSVRHSLDGSPDLKQVLNHPAIDNEKKKALLSSLFASKVDELTMNVLKLLTDKGRLPLLRHIESEYKILLNNLNQIVTAQLIGSAPLAEGDIANLKARLTEHLGKRMELDVSVDQSLIGGFILRLGDQVIDGSLKGKLRAIEKTLQAV
jgi:F-type H+-transporting ATPase subunit delta